MGIYGFGIAWSLAATPWQVTEVQQFLRSNTQRNGTAVLLLLRFTHRIDTVGLSKRSFIVRGPSPLRVPTEVAAGLPNVRPLRGTAPTEAVHVHPKPQAGPRPLERVS